MLPPPPPTACLSRCGEDGPGKQMWCQWQAAGLQRQRREGNTFDLLNNLHCMNNTVRPRFNTHLRSWVMILFLSLLGIFFCIMKKKAILGRRRGTSKKFVWSVVVGDCPRLRDVSLSSFAASGHMVRSCAPREFRDNAAFCKCVLNHRRHTVRNNVILRSLTP